MAIFIPKNQYAGVNPHLNSLLQTSGQSGDSGSRFPAFHAALIAQIAIHLNQHLPENYIAVAEESLQLVAIDDSRRAKPDVTLFQRERNFIPTAAAAAVIPTPTWEAELEATLDPLDALKAVKVYRVENAQMGEVVACFEVLSPANKIGGSHYSAYRVKRRDYLHGNIPLIEIDLLHESHPIIATHPIYPDDEDSYPYYVALSDPRPQAGLTRAYGVEVDQALPTLPLDLDDGLRVQVDFDAIYQQTFEQHRFYLLADYAVLPVRFDTYSRQDQQQIQRRMSELIAKFGTR